MENPPAVTRSEEILTVGHSNHEEADFLALLRGAGIELVVDVRRHPSSRRLPHFERSALAASLKEAGIDYEWMGEELGGRRQPAPDSVNDAWEDGQARGYADHMGSEEFAAALAELERLGSGRRTAVICAEADWHHCHRRMVSDALVARGGTVLHLRETGGVEPHELPEFAAVNDGRVTYPAAQTSLDL
jgi:uncharacterized protein (DUF488 family)